MSLRANNGTELLTVIERTEAIQDYLDRVPRSLTCEFLRKIPGLYYCGKGLPENILLQTERIGNDPIIYNQQGLAELQLYCKSNFKNCTYRRDDVITPGERAYNSAKA